MTPDERAHAVDYLEQTKAALLETAAALSAHQWFQKPSPEQWCPAECIEHLSLTENALCRALRKISLGPPPSPEELAAAAGKESMIEKAVPSRGRRVKGPPQAMPQLESTDPQEILARFLEIRARSIDYARTTTDPLRERVFPHFVFGPIDGYQWLIFMAAHSERHRRQIVEITASLEKTAGN